MRAKNKRGVSEIVGYVLLVVIAITISTIVYFWLKGYLPKQGLECPEEITVSIIDYKCNPPTVNFTFKNTGLFNIDGIVAKGTDRPEKAANYPLIAQGYAAGRDYKGDYPFLNGSKPQALKPEEIYERDFSYYRQGTPVSVVSIKKIQVIPFKILERNKKKEQVLCTRSTATLNLDCELGERLLPQCNNDGDCDEGESYSNCRDDCCNSCASGDGICKLVCTGDSDGSCPVLKTGCDGQAAGTKFCSGNKLITCCGTEEDCTDSGKVCSVDRCIDETLCPNSVCDAGETCETCPQDCGACPSNCEADCTYTTDNICHTECNNVNGCQFFVSACDNLLKGVKVCANDHMFATCCANSELCPGGLPYCVGEGECVSASPLAFLDNFDRADGTDLGINWTETAGDFRIVSNFVNKTMAGRNIALVDIPIFQNVHNSTQVIKCSDVSGDLRNNSCGIIARYTDENNYYILTLSYHSSVSYPFGEKYLNLSKKVGGVTIPINITASGAPSFVILYFVIKGTNLSVYTQSDAAFNDPFIRISVIDSSLQSTNSRVGMYLAGQTNPRIDWYNITKTQQ